MMEYFYIGLWGLFLGSFLNVLADRLFIGDTLLGRSKCDKCHHKLNWFDLIPVISYTLIKGKCRYCKAPISIQYPIVEICTSALYVLTYYLTQKFSFNLFDILINLALVSVLIVLVLSDIRYHAFSDYMLYAFLSLASLKNAVNIFSEESSFAQILPQLFNIVLSSILVALPLFMIYMLTRKKGMGLGDVILALGIGALLGTMSGLLAIYIAFVTGGIYGAYLLIVRKGKPKTVVPFGPFLIFSTYFVMFFEYDLYRLIGSIYSF